MQLYSMDRNSAGWRVRIALELKALRYDYVSTKSLADGQYKAINPQGLMPALELDGRVIAQSGAILELIEELHPSPSLFPEDPLDRAEARSFGQLIACDLHPINNNRVRRYLADAMGQPDAAISDWVRHWSAVALASLETMLERRGAATRFAFGDSPGFAELHLVPQLYNCRRTDCDLSPYPRLLAIDRACREIEAFRAAAPEQMPDFDGSVPRWIDLR
jgi:maleylacetoacetate isomerase